MADRRFTDGDPMNDLMDERMTGGAAPSSGALKGAGRGGYSSAQINQMARDMVQRDAQAARSMQPMNGALGMGSLADLAAAALGIYGLNGTIGRMQNAGPQAFRGAQQGPLATTTGVVPYTGGPLPMGNAFGSLSNSPGIPGQPQLGNSFTNTNAQMGMNLYNMANNAFQNAMVGGVQGLGRGLQNTGNFLQSSGVANFVANPLTSTGNSLAGFGQQARNAGSPLQVNSQRNTEPTTFTDPYALSRRSQAGSDMRNR